MDIFASPPQPSDSHCTPLSLLSRIKWEEPLRLANKLHRGHESQASGQRDATVHHLLLWAVTVLSWGFSTEPQFLSSSAPVGLFYSSCFSQLWLEFPWDSRDLSTMAYYRRLTSFFTKGFQWVIYHRALSLFNRAEIPLRNNSEKRKMRRFQALSSRFLTTKLWQWILLRGVISLQVAILCH